VCLSEVAGQAGEWRVDFDVVDLADDRLEFCDRGGELPTRSLTVPFVRIRGTGRFCFVLSAELIRPSAMRRSMTRG